MTQVRRRRCSVRSLPISRHLYLNKSTWRLLKIVMCFKVSRVRLLKIYQNPSKGLFWHLSTFFTREIPLRGNFGLLKMELLKSRLIYFLLQPWEKLFPYMVRKILWLGGSTFYCQDHTRRSPEPKILQLPIKYKRTSLWNVLSRK